MREGRRKERTGGLDQLGELTCVEPLVRKQASVLCALTFHLGMMERLSLADPLVSHVLQPGRIDLALSKLLGRVNDWPT